MRRRPGSSLRWSSGTGDRRRTRRCAAFAVVGDAIPASLTGAAGDAAAARDRRQPPGRPLPALPHRPVSRRALSGQLWRRICAAPGARWSAAQLRLRFVDGSRLNPDTIMPSYYRVDHLERVGRAWQGKPVLTAQQIEDVVAFLATFRD